MNKVKIKVFQEVSKKQFEMKIAQFLNNPTIEMIHMDFTPTIIEGERIRYLALLVYSPK